MAQHGCFVWNELNTRDPEAAKQFYGAVFGWTFDSMPMPEGGTYWVGRVGETAAAGLFTMSGPHFEGVPEHWLAYVEVDDVDKRVVEVAAKGGTVLRAPWAVPGVGRIAIIKDAGGAPLGVMTSSAAAS